MGVNLDHVFSFRTLEAASCYVIWLNLNNGNSCLRFLLLMQLIYYSNEYVTDLHILPFWWRDSRSDDPFPGLPKALVLRLTLPFWPYMIKYPKTVQYLLKLHFGTRMAFYSHPPLRKSTFLSTKVFFIRSTRRQPWIFLRLWPWIVSFVCSELE